MGTFKNVKLLFEIKRKAPTSIIVLFENWNSQFEILPYVLNYANIISKCFNKG